MAYFSPLRYPGGKLKLYSFILEVLEMNNLNKCTYVEPYVGGAGLALALLINGTVSKLIINDYDKSIFAFWYSILNHKDDFLKKVLEESGVSKDEAMAFGDHWNDKEMLQYVKYGYLMGNAPENLKEVFDKEKIIAANNEDGVAQILEKLI